MRAFKANPIPAILDHSYYSHRLLPTSPHPVVISDITLLTVNLVIFPLNTVSRHSLPSFPHRYSGSRLTYVSRLDCLWPLFINHLQKKNWNPVGTIKCNLQLHQWHPVNPKTIRITVKIPSPIHYRYELRRMASGLTRSTAREYHGPCVHL